ncbi:ATPase [Treponema sp. OMZ 840]|uniref:V-type ATP synthase subunit I n=1 Tax=Treponema sp. OMZ 840 TaxID=244313 RepID=UPI003D934DB1
MAKTTAMRLLELMILKEDISRVIEYLGKNGNFEFQTGTTDSQNHVQNTFRDLFEKLQTFRSYLNIEDAHDYDPLSRLPEQEDIDSALTMSSAVEDLRQRELAVSESKKRVDDAYKEALAFSNLKVAYAELEHLSFLSLRIGKIDPAVLDDLIFNVGQRAVIMPLGEDKTRILAASSKKGRFALDSELRRYGFVPLEIPKDFKGIPDDVLEGMKEQTQEERKKLEEVIQERRNYAHTHKAELLRLLRCFSIGAQVQEVQSKLESTQLVYRITGWVPAPMSSSIMKDLDNLTEGRIALRQYNPGEVPSVTSGREKVPVKLTHGKLVGNFERLIFSYGAPLYGTIDPTPFVAFFFTLLFGIMFGDAGQGLVFILIGILMLKGVIKKFPVSPQFGPIFVAIGCSSTVMGILTGEFFANGELLIPVSRFLTGLFGEPHDHILHLMPSASAIDKLFMFFLFTIGVGFIINSIGLIINIANNFMLGKRAHALFGKTGLSGALFFWYVVSMAVRIGAFGSSPKIYDWIAIGITLFGVFFAHPLGALVEGHRPIFPNGIGSAFIEGVVEILEIVSSYLSNSVSFLRVGAFALAHAVLGFIIFTMTELIGGAGGLLVQILGNAVVIVLEGMIVAIQVIRLQYYEFFSKFFTETGREFTPFRFKYK